MTILDLIVDSGLVLTGSEARRLIAHDCVWLLPEGWDADGGPTPSNIRLITNPNHILEPNSLVNIHKHVYRYIGPGRFELVHDGIRKGD